MNTDTLGLLDDSNATEDLRSTPSPGHALRARAKQQQQQQLSMLYTPDSKASPGGPLTPFSPLFARNRSSSSLWREEAMMDVSLALCRRVSVAVVVHDDDGDKERSLFPLTYDNGNVSSREVVVVHPDRWEGSSAATMETARLVAAAHNTTEDWVQSYKFHTTIFGDPTETLSTLVQAVANDLTTPGSTAQRLLVGLSSLSTYQTAQLFGKVTQHKSVARVFAVPRDLSSTHDILTEYGVVGLLLHLVLATCTTQQCTLSVLEIVGDEHLYDLLATKPYARHASSNNNATAVRISSRDGICRVTGLSHVRIDSLKQVGHVFRRAFAAAQHPHRKTARGHVLATVTVGDSCYCRILDVVAGSTTNTTPAMRQSVSALGRVLRTALLREAGSYRPMAYRDSLLTKVLQTSFASADSRVVVVSNVASRTAHYEESMSTLRFLNQLLARPGQPAHSPFNSSSNKDNKERVSVDDVVHVPGQEGRLLQEVLSDPRQRLAKAMRRSSPSRTTPPPQRRAYSGGAATHYEDPFDDTAPVVATEDADITPLAGNNKVKRPVGRFFEGKVNLSHLYDEMESGRVVETHADDFLVDHLDIGQEPTSDLWGADRSYGESPGVANGEGIECELASHPATGRDTEAPPARRTVSFAGDTPPTDPILDDDEVLFPSESESLLVSNHVFGGNRQELSTPIQEFGSCAVDDDEGLFGDNIEQVDHASSRPPSAQWTEEGGDRLDYHSALPDENDPTDPLLTFAVASPPRRDVPMWGGNKTSSNDTPPILQTFADEDALSSRDHDSYDQPSARQTSERSEQERPLQLFSAPQAENDLSDPLLAFAAAPPSFRDVPTWGESNSSDHYERIPREREKYVTDDTHVSSFSSRDQNHATSSPVDHESGFARRVKGSATQPVLTTNHMQSGLSAEDEVRRTMEPHHRLRADPPSRGPPRKQSQQETLVSRARIDPPIRPISEIGGNNDLLRPPDHRKNHEDKGRFTNEDLHPQISQPIADLTSQRKSSFSLGDEVAPRLGQSPNGSISTASSGRQGNESAGDFEQGNMTSQSLAILGRQRKPHTVTNGDVEDPFRDSARHLKNGNSLRTGTHNINDADHQDIRALSFATQNGKKDALALGISDNDSANGRMFQNPSRDSEHLASLELQDTTKSVPSFQNNGGSRGSSRISASDQQFASSATQNSFEDVSCLSSKGSGNFYETNTQTPLLERLLRYPSEASEEVATCESGQKSIDSLLRETDASESIPRLGNGDLPEKPYGDQGDDLPPAGQVDQLMLKDPSGQRLRCANQTSGSAIHRSPEQDGDEHLDGAWIDSEIAKIRLEPDKATTSDGSGANIYDPETAPGATTERSETIGEVCLPAKEQNGRRNLGQLKERRVNGQSRTHPETRVAPVQRVSKEVVENQVSYDLPPSTPTESSNGSDRGDLVYNDDQLDDKYAGTETRPIVEATLPVGQTHGRSAFPRTLESQTHESGTLSNQLRHQQSKKLTQRFKLQDAKTIDELRTDDRANLDSSTIPSHVSVGQEGSHGIELGAYEFMKPAPAQAEALASRTGNSDHMGEDTIELPRYDHEERNTLSGASSIIPSVRVETAYDLPPVDPNGSNVAMPRPLVEPHSLTTTDSFAEQETSKNRLLESRIPHYEAKNQERHSEATFSESLDTNIPSATQRFVGGRSGRSFVREETPGKMNGYSFPSSLETIATVKRTSHQSTTEALNRLRSFEAENRSRSLQSRAAEASISPIQVDSPSRSHRSTAQNTTATEESALHEIDELEAAVDKVRQTNISVWKDSLSSIDNLRHLQASQLNELAKLKSERNQARDEATRLENKLQSLTETHNRNARQYEAERESMKEEIADGKTVKEEVVKIAESAIAMQAELEKKVDRLEEENRRQRDNTVSKDEHENIVLRSRDLTRYIESLKQEIQKLRLEVEETNKVLGEANHSLNITRNKVNQLRTEKQEAIELIHSLRAQLVASQRIAKELESAQEDYRRTEQQAEIALRSERDKQTELTRQLESLTVEAARVPQLTSEVESLRFELSSYKSNLSTAEEESSLLATEKAGLTERLERTTEELDRRVQDVKELTTCTKRLLEEKEGDRVKISNMESALSSFQTETRSRVENVARHRNEAAALLKRALEENKALEETNKRLSASYEELEREHSECRRRLENQSGQDGRDRTVLDFEMDSGAAAPPAMRHRRTESTPPRRGLDDSDSREPSLMRSHWGSSQLHQSRESHTVREATGDGVLNRTEQLAATLALSAKSRLERVDGYDYNWDEKLYKLEDEKDHEIDALRNRIKALERRTSARSRWPQR